jgi:UTP--glucose-1-phosphate uridylyltransferase
MSQHIRKAVIPVAGYGTRFLPFTKSNPKEMLPLVDRPIIQYIVEEAVKAGIEQIILITGSNKRAIEDYFDYNRDLENQLQKTGKTELLELVRSVSDLAQFVYIRQKEMLGLGHAIAQARSVVGDEPFAVLYGDDIIDSKTPVLKQMIDLYAQNPGVIVGVTEVPKASVSNYGVIDGQAISDNVYKINRFVEKPDPESSPSRLVSTGRLILPPTIFDSINQTQPGKGGEIQIVDAISHLISQNTPAHALHYEGHWYDCGSKTGYVKAVVNYALKRSDLDLSDLSLTPTGEN